MKILLLIPAFDEEAHIREIVNAAKLFVPDIMVVDDGSNDATTLVAALAGAMVHRLKTNTGKGEALKVGFTYAVEKDYDTVLTVDGDGQHSPEDIPAFLSLVSQYDLLLGTRVPGPDRVPFFRSLANFVCDWIVTIRCRRRIRDSQNGFRAYSVRLLRELQLNSTRYDLETEVLIRAARRKLRIGSTEVHTIYSGGSSRRRLFKDSARFVAVIFRSFFW